jgi:hypothetical protein
LRLVDDGDSLFSVDEDLLEAGHDVGLDLLTVDEEQVWAITVVLLLIGIVLILFKGIYKKKFITIDDSKFFGCSEMIYLFD